MMIGKTMVEDVKPETDIKDNPDAKAEEVSATTAKVSGSPQEKTSEAPLEKADRINKEKKENLELEAKNLDRREKLEAEARVGGRSDAGQEPPKEKEIDPVQYSKDALAGNVGDGKEE